MDAKKSFKVIYKGARDGQDYDDFTFNNAYSAREVKEGEFLVLNDRAVLVLMPSIDFDFESSSLMMVSK